MKRLGAKIKSAASTSSSATDAAAETARADRDQEFAIKSACSDQEKNGGTESSDGSSSLQEHQPLTQLSAADRATQETVFHHNKAGLATKFRSRRLLSQELEVDFVEARNLSTDGFWDGYVSCNRPVVILNAVVPEGGWPNSDCFTIAALTSRVGHSEVNLRCFPLQGRVFGDVSRFQKGLVKPYDYERVTMATFFESLQQEEPPYYAARLELQEDMVELAGDIPSHYELPWRRCFGRPYKDGVISYMGAAGQQTPLHYDDVENMMFVLAGSKTVMLYPPSEALLLYPAPVRLGTHYCTIPTAALDPSSAEADDWPLVRQARGITVTVPAGSALYLPCSWLHSVRGSLDFNMTANYWFAQSPSKMDRPMRQAFEERVMTKWVRQLGTMGLPASVMAEAHAEAPRLVAKRVAMYEDWDWDRPEDSLRLAVLH